MQLMADILRFGLSLRLQLARGFEMTASGGARYTIPNHTSSKPNFFTNGRSRARGKPANSVMI